MPAKSTVVAFSVAALFLTGAGRAVAQNTPLPAGNVEAFQSNLSIGPVTYRVDNAIIISGNRYKITTTLTGKSIKTTVTLIGLDPMYTVGVVPPDACGLDQRKIALDLENALVEQTVVSLGLGEPYVLPYPTRRLVIGPPKILVFGDRSTKFSFRLPKRSSPGVVWMQFVHWGSFQPVGLTLVSVPNMKDRTLRFNLLGDWTRDHIEKGMYESHEGSYQCLGQ